jgi:O-antigen chain-terminating methyltransferase
VSVGEDTIDPRRLIENIRRHLSPLIEQLPPTFGLVADPSSGPAIPHTDRRAQDLTLLRGRIDPFEIRLRSHRKIFGWPVVAAKKLLRQLLTPVLEWQSAYNATALRLVESLDRDARAAGVELDRRTGELRQRLAELEPRLGELGQRLTALDLRAGELRQGFTDLDRRAGTLESEVGHRLEDVESRIGRRFSEIDRVQRAMAEAVETHRQQVARAERTLRRLLHERSQSATAGELRPSGDEALAKSTPRADLAGVAFDYFAFEERYRGSEAEIRRQHRRYLRHVAGAGPVLDLGCGRGEFLEALREAGIAARGVDLDLDMVLLCRDKGLDVAHDDLFRFLEAVPDSSLGAVFSSQVVEHLAPAAAIRLIDAARRTLRPDGVLIIETINPRCLTVFARSFFLDPSHVWPWHPDTMRFVLETRGFREIETEFFNPVVPADSLPQFRLTGPRTDGEGTQHSLDLLNELLFSHQDYAIVGRKSAADPADASTRSR